MVFSRQKCKSAITGSYKFKLNKISVDHQCAQNSKGSKLQSTVMTAVITRTALVCQHLTSGTIYNIGIPLKWQQQGKCAFTELLYIAQCNLCIKMHSTHHSCAFKASVNFCKSHKMMCQTIFTRQICAFMQFFRCSVSICVELFHHPIGWHLWLIFLSFSLPFAISSISFDFFQQIASIII